MTGNPFNENGEAPEQSDFILDSDRGRIAVRSKCPQELFDSLKMDSGLGHFSHYSSIIKTVDSFKKYAAREDGRVTLAINEPDVIVGYCVGSYPEPNDRWSILGKLMYELAALELSRDFRGLNLAYRLLRQTMNDDFF